MCLLPAGLIDENVEIFATPTYGKCMATFNGKVVGFWDIPEEVISGIEDEALADKKAMATFKEDGITDLKAITEAWAWCNLGRYDKVADYNTSSGSIKKEYHDCGRRGKCPHEFKRCSKVQVDDGFLTARETECVIHMARGFADKEIAERMGLQEVSMISLCQRVREEIGARNRVDVAIWDTKNGLID